MMMIMMIFVDGDVKTLVILVDDDDDKKKDFFKLLQYVFNQKRTVRK